MTSTPRLTSTCPVRRSLADYNTMNDLIKIFGVKKSHLTEDLEDLSKMMNMFHSSNRDAEAVFKSTNIV